MDIPVLHFFNNKYVTPAAVSFYSMLENADKNQNYILYVGHSDITKENQEKLKKTIENFKNAQLEFINMNNKFDDLFKKTKMGGNFSKEMYYKFLAASLLPQYDKVIITDVDVVFLGDIAKEFIDFDISEEYYLAGAKSGLSRSDSWIDKFSSRYDKDFSFEERKLLNFAGGYYIFNCKKIRKDNLESKFISFAFENCKRIIQPEQDTINICCGDKKKALSPRALVCTYLYDMYRSELDFNKGSGYDAATIKDALNNPIQVHYATTKKPWLEVCPKQELWFSYLAKTPFFEEYMRGLMPENKKVLFKFTILGRTFKFTKEHAKYENDGCFIKAK